MAALSLVVLAAGLGSRFGGDKQLVSVGPEGEVIFDFAVRDAHGAGVDHVVLVVRSDIEAEVRAHIARRWPRDVATSVVCQDRDPLMAEAAAAGRTAPLGTAHAVACGVRSGGVEGPFLVVNADDLYPPEAYGLLAGQLGRRRDAAALVTFELANTIVGARPVRRALCEIDGARRLRGIEEGTVAPVDGGYLWEGVSGSRAILAGAEPVSMNCWGFAPDLVDVFEESTRRFVASDRVTTTEEVLLPDVVRELLGTGMSFVALPSSGRCIGVTHAQDLDAVRRGVAEGPWWAP